MNEIVKLSMLLEIYKNLITEKQRDVLNLYYNEDMSLAEIAEEFRISRQAVRDNIKNGEKNLINYEEKLKVFDKKTRMLEVFNNIDDENIDIKSLKKKLNKIKRILEE